MFGFVFFLLCVQPYLSKGVVVGSSWPPEPLVGPEIGLTLLAGGWSWGWHGGPS